MVVFLLLLVLMLGSCDNNTQTQGGLSWNSIVSILEDVGTLRFLGMGDSTPQYAPLFGLLRLLVGILVFALLFEGSRVVGLSRNVSITICIILAILSVVLIPTTILVTISSSYGFIV